MSGGIVVPLHRPPKAQSIGASAGELVAAYLALRPDQQAYLLKLAKSLAAYPGES